MKRIKRYKEWIKESVGDLSVPVSSQMTTGNSAIPNQANLARAREWVEVLAAKNRKKLFKIANLQSGKKLSWEEWKWDIDKAMDVATQYYAENPESIGSDNGQISTFPVATNYVPYTNNIGGVYRQNTSQIRSVMGDSNALGPNSFVN